MKDIRIGNREIGLNHPTYFVADVAANHDGDLQRAIDLIYLCKEAGADAAKFQNFKAESIVSRRGFEELGDKVAHQASWKKSVFEIYQDASVNPDWTPILRKTCEDAGIHYFTSPYDFDSVDSVDPHVVAYKIGSGDITWPGIMEYMATKGKPVLLATGASDMSDVRRAMSVLLPHTRDLVLMQCNTNYTGSLENFRYINLNVLKQYAAEWPDVVLGLSDHTPGHATVLGAIALGARVVEKHFTDDNHREGPDHKFSMTPTTWREMVDRSRELENALGDGHKRIEANEKKSAVVQRRSLRARQGMPVGKALDSSDLEPLRPIPEDGLPPYELEDLVGKKLVKPIAAGEHITRSHFEI